MCVAFECNIIEVDLKIQKSLFTNKFMNIMCAVKENSRCLNLSCSVVNAFVVFASCLFWELHIQGDSEGTCITLGNDSMSDSK